MNGVRKWPNSWWAHAGLALIGAIPITILCSWLVFRLSFLYYVRLYPHDGQDVLGSVFLWLLSLPVFAIGSFVLLFWIQKRWRSAARRG
jgi:hypothetical protein